MSTKQPFLGEAITKEYKPAHTTFTFSPFRLSPAFNVFFVREMLADPRVTFGLYLIKGPLLANARFFIDCDNAEVKSFLRSTVNRFWRNGALIALKAVEWGYSCSEVIYRLADGLIHYDQLKHLNSIDCRVFTSEGKLAGASVRGIPSRDGGPVLYPPRLLWHVHNRHENRWYGESRLKGAYLPWLEKWDKGGFRDSRRLFLYKFAFGGETGYYPPGTTVDEQGNPISNQSLMLQMLERKRNGAAVALPAEYTETGQLAWRIEPQAPPPISPLYPEWGTRLDDEIWEGMGIPAEVARAEGTGAYAGRRVPLVAFYTILQMIANSLAEDLNTQILRPLVERNFGPGVHFDLIPIPMLQAHEEEGETVANFSLVPAHEVVSEEPPQGYTIRYGKPP
ncbi:MAG: hypothetical protein JRI66_09155 [Deltaproteobacteria bacterium]|nr:hypothetical protein [Deltaproteobacteria bacterium]